ncbi:hypothetical protein Tco_0305128 [Tanacetum coccineum]
MFVQAHDPDYVPEPIYPKYIPLEDDHEFLAEEQPLPPIDSPITESPYSVTRCRIQEDPEEYEDDETEDGPVDYPMDEGDDGDDDEGDSSRDDANDEDEDEEDEEEEEHLASTSVIPPPTTDITIWGPRIIPSDPQTSISLPLEAEAPDMRSGESSTARPTMSRWNRLWFCSDGRFFEIGYRGLRVGYGIRDTGL